MKNFFGSSLSYGSFFAILAFILYGYGHFNKYNNLDFYEGGTISAAFFSVVINFVLLIKTLVYDDVDLGKLRVERGAIILGITFSIFYASTDVAKGFGKVFLPEKIEKTLKALDEPIKP